MRILYIKRLKPSMNGSSFCDKLLNEKEKDGVFFIWYEPDGNDSIQTFIKENANKIRLTSSELIRALLLSETEGMSDIVSKIREAIAAECDYQNNTVDFDSLKLIRDLFQVHLSREKSGENSISSKERQLIAIEWENIEYQLSKSSFWFFLTNKEKRATCIDIVFDCLANYWTDKDVGYPELRDSLKKTKRLDPHHEYFSFYVIDAIFNLDSDDQKTFLKDYLVSKDKATEENIKKALWECVLECFALFADFYEDFKKYHKIGFLIAASSTKRSEEMYEIFKNVKTNGKKNIENGIKEKKEIEDIEDIIDKEIKEIIYKKYLEIDPYSDDKIEKKIKEHLLRLNFKKDKDKIRKILLLFNILTVLQETKSEQKRDQTANDILGARTSPYENHYRFPFEKFKRKRGANPGSWDLEHIHAVNSQLPDKIEDIKEVLELYKEEFKEEGLPVESERMSILYSVSSLLLDKSCNENEIFEKLKKLPKELRGKDELSSSDIKSNIQKIYNTIIKKSKENRHIEDDNTIRNLTLLDSRTNREYQDKAFSEKRKIIICREREGRFIPLCTKNVFLKLYTDNPQKLQLQLWTNSDKEDYLKEITQVLVAYIK